MKLTPAVKDAYKNLSDADKEALKLGKELFASRIIYSVVRAVLVHAIGRKVAPQIFTSFGRSYVISGLARLALTTPRLSEDQKVRVLAVAERQRLAKEAKKASE